MRAIDADALINRIVFHTDFETDVKELFEDEINAEPTIEPEIVRCKDCRYYQDNNGGYPHMNCKWDANETPDEDDFCSGAERRTDVDANT